MIWRCDLVPQYLRYQDEIELAMRRVLGSGRYILAEEVAAFEAEYARYVGVAHAVAVASGTDGLTLALRALDIGAGDEVVTTSLSAIPTVSAIVDSGATPVFVDVEPDTFLMNLEGVRGALTSRTRAVMPVHLFGSVVDVPRLRDIVGAIPIVEDASQAHGSTLHGQRAGSFGDLAVFSFYPTKNLGGYGDGGAVVTDRDELAARLRRLRMYGMVDKDHIATHGVNSRLDEIQAAVLRVKLPHLDGMNRARAAVAARYHAELPDEIFSHQRVPAEVESNYHVFAARVRGDRDGLVDRLEKAGVQTNVYYPVPLHLQEANRDLGWRRGSLPVVEQVCTDIIALPMYAELTASDLETVIEEILRAVRSS